MLENEVRPGANRYVSGENTLQELPNYLDGFKKIAVITGVTSFQIFRSFYREAFDYPIYRYDGTASMENAQVLAKEIKESDLIIGIGGGRVLDTAKMTAEILDTEVLLIPTLISNCAPFTPITVIYNIQGSFLYLGYLKKAPYLTLVDTCFLLATPKDYFVAGIGDTLAKWYEIEGITRQLSENEKSAYVRLAIQSAKTIQEMLLADASQAVADLEAECITPAFSRITDTIIGLAGEVGGFAAHLGRASGAHAVHDGLSYLSETHDILHGMKVAYGILVQLAYTGDFEEIRQLIPFYRKLGLPWKLTHLTIKKHSEDYLKPALIHAASPQDTFRFIDPDVTAEKIYQAISKLESLSV